MKKILNRIILVIGIIFIILILISNVLFDVRLADDISEYANVEFIHVANLALVCLLSVGITCILKKIKLIEKIKPKYRIIIIVAILLIYFIAQVIWINYRNASPGWDSGSVYEIAKGLYKGDYEAISSSTYAEKNPHQIPLAFMESLALKIQGSENFRIFQYFNAIANVAIVIAIALISKELMPDCKYTSMCLIIAFIPLSLLTTFIYGDIVGLAFALWSIFFLIKSKKQERWYYVLMSSVLLALAIICRKNMLIFAIAEVIYLILNIILEKPKLKKTLLSFLIAIAFLLISLVPSKIIIALIQNKYNINSANQAPATTYFYMGMTTGERGNGWYNSNADWVWDYPIDEAKEMYNKAIKERTKYLITHPIDLIKFYTTKNVSMYAENTYAGLFYNESFCFGYDEYKNIEKDEAVISFHERLQLYQKALMIIIFGFTLIMLIKNRKDISNEELLLLLVFIGGFLFHNIWEAKSRYIIPYLVILIPLASKGIETKLKDYKDEERKKRKSKT